MKLITRAQWGARDPKAPAARLSTTKGVKVHYTGATESMAMVTDHSRCILRVRAIQAGHMDGNDWNDIGYSFLVCPHGDVFEGRGLHRLPAANGSGLNAGHYAVCGLVGNRGLVDPSPAMLSGMRDAIDYCRESGGAGREIKGHRDGYSTDCPGPKLYAWVRAGAPRPASAPTKIKRTEDLVKELPTLKLHDSGPDVETAQALLVARGYRAIKIDGAFGSKTETAVRAEKQAHRLDDNGIVGPATWAVLLRVA